MLLEFKVKNFKSFYDEAVFSMIPAPKQKGLDYSVLKEKYKGGNACGLCSSVIYGPNAAGKTNIIEAMDVFRSIILRGNLKNSDDTGRPNPAASNLELIPNKGITVAQPVEFYIDFIDENTRFQYTLVADLGCFLEEDKLRNILFERLDVNGKNVFFRDQSIDISPNSIPKMYCNDCMIDLKIAIGFAAKSLQPDELFLINGFKLIFSPVLVKVFTEWFARKFMVICRADSLQLIKRFSDSQKKGVYVDLTTQKAAKLFGINSNMLGYVATDDESEQKLFSIFHDLNSHRHVAIPAEDFESFGTVRFMNMFPLIIRAIMTGSTLVVDEFDASIHPMALMNIINIFHNDEINIHHAQLIFNTHNPIFLNANLLRRDELKFVERDDQSHNSTIYTLADFGTSGENGVRKNEDYLKNYFVSRYGAIKDIDFTPIFEELIAEERGA